MTSSERWPAVALLMAAVVALGSCGGSSESGASAGSVTTMATNEERPAMERLAGRYAHFDAVAYEDEAMKTLIISYGFTDLEVVDGELVSTDSFCFSEHRSDQPITVTMSDAATQAIRPVPVPVTVRVTDGVTRIFRPETPTPIGIRLDDPANESLPTDPNDPRIVDDDGDGNPGVTAHVVLSAELEGNVYLARREIFSYELTEQDDGSLTGSVADRSEQLVIGASDPVFAAETQWEQVGDPSKSPIMLAPVDDDWDCDRLRAERDNLFPPTPEVDW